MQLLHLIKKNIYDKRNGTILNMHLKKKKEKGNKEGIHCSNKT